MFTSIMYSILCFTMVMDKYLLFPYSMALLEDERWPSV